MVLTAVLCSGAACQNDARPNSSSPATVPGLEILPVESAGTQHRVGSKFTNQIDVKVIDERKRVVPGAEVVFQMTPGTTGASASIADLNLLVTQTDVDGIASLKGLRANGAAGRYQIHVNASFEGKSGRGDIEQENVPPPILERKRTLLASAAAIAILVPILALRPSQPPKATISTVTPTGPVGQP